MRVFSSLTVSFSLPMSSRIRCTGWGLHPLESAALSRRTPKPDHFQVGSVAKAYRALDNYTAVRLRPVVALQAQGQAAQGRDLSPLAPLRALRSRTPDHAWVQRAVGEGVTSCPRAGCGKSACLVVCPVKAGMFSTGQTSGVEVRAP